ncbi:MAG: hypothetical protein AABO57_24220 [Acidobacteriota bacterium]
MGKGSRPAATGLRLEAITRPASPTQNLPDTWNGETGANIKWKARIPGLAHSCGKELWRLGGSSKITAPTPVFSDPGVL